MIKIYNCETGETIEREMTAEEKSAFELSIAINKKADEDRASAEATKASALAKLAALGLTEDEVNGLIS